MKKCCILNLQTLFSSSPFFIAQVYVQVLTIQCMDILWGYTGVHKIKQCNQDIYKFPMWFLVLHFNCIGMPANAKSSIRGCAEKLSEKKRCSLFYFMFVEIRYVSTCAVAIRGERVANCVISHCKKMAKVRVSFGVACSFMPEDKNQAWFMSSNDTHP